MNKSDYYYIWEEFISFNVSGGSKPQFVSVQISDAPAKLSTETRLPTRESTKQMEQKMPVLKRPCDTFLQIQEKNASGNYSFKFLEQLDFCKDGNFVEEMARGGRGRDKRFLSVSFISQIHNDGQRVSLECGIACRNSDFPSPIVQEKNSVILWGHAA